MAAGGPPAEVEVDEALVRALLRQQHPDLAGERIVPVDSGWDNSIFRIGTDLAARLPRRRLAVRLARNERRWLPILGPDLPLPVPAPARLGEPGAGFPWPWSVVPWLPGRTADREPPGADQAPRLAAFLRALHRPAPSTAPENPFRGGPLSGRAEAVAERLRRRRGDRDLPAPIAGLWEEALAAPTATARCWVHGDLHARNVLVEEGRITGIIDWGDLTAGDPATDLASAWLLFEAESSRTALLEAYGAGDDQVIRARGWAVLLGSVLVDSGEPRHVALGEATLRRLARDPRPGAPRS